MMGMARRVRVHKNASCFCLQCCGQCLVITVCLHAAAIRQAIAKSLVAFYQKYVDEASKREIKVRGFNHIDRGCRVHSDFECTPAKSAWQQSAALGLVQAIGWQIQCLHSNL